MPDEPTTQEAEKALETVQGYISDCCPSCGNDAVTFEGGCDHPWHEADAALRSLRTQQERAQALENKATHRLAEYRRDVERELDRRDAQATKDQERIEELTEALDEIQDRSTCPAHPTCPHGCEGIAREVLHTTESHTPTHPKEGAE